MSNEREKVRLISVVEAKDPNGKDAWSVTLGFFPYEPRQHAGPMLTASFFMAKKDNDEGEIVRVARHFFHGLCRTLGEETVEWAIPKGHLPSVRRGETPPSPATEPSPQDEALE